jgi:DNA gyrase subunit A
MSRAVREPASGTLTSVTSDEGARAAARERLKILDALAAAIERRSEVFEAIVTSKSADEAQSTIAALLDVSELGACAVLDLQWRRMAERERNRILDERNEIRAILA